ISKLTCVSPLSKVGTRAIKSSKRRALDIRGDKHSSKRPSSSWPILPLPVPAGNPESLTDNAGMAPHQQPKGLASTVHYYFKNLWMLAATRDARDLCTDRV